MSVITSKFQEILLSGFRGVALTRKTGLTDWLTDWLTDGSKTLYPPQLVAWGIITKRNIIKCNITNCNIIKCNIFKRNIIKHNIIECNSTCIASRPFRLLGNGLKLHVCPEHGHLPHKKCSHRLLLEYLASLVEGWSFVISCSGHRQVMFHDKSSHRQLVARVLRAQLSSRAMCMSEHNYIVWGFEKSLTNGWGTQGRPCCSKYF